MSVCCAHTGLDTVTSSTYSYPSTSVCQSLVKLSLLSTVIQFSKYGVSVVTFIQSAVLIDCDSISLPYFSVI